MTIAWETDFAGGNGKLLGVDESRDRVVARFAAEPRNCPLAMWFHFRVSGLAGRGLRVVLANAHRTLGGEDWSGNRIVCRGGAGPWERAQPPVAIDAGDGLREWAWEIPADADLAEVAHCYPYQPADMDATLAELAPAFSRAATALTMGGRTIPRVFSRPGESDRPGVLLTARHHAGETPGSWVLDGLLRHVAAEPRLADAVTWWAVPFVDLDDVVTGSYGKDPYPCDCNRGYGPGPFRRPESVAVMADARRLKTTSQRVLMVDLHAPCHGEQKSYIPVRGWAPDSPINPIAIEFADRLQQAVPEAIRSPVAHITPEPTSGPYQGMPSARWALSVLGVEALTIETSYQGNGQRYYGIDDYRRIGQALAETIAAWVNRPPAERP